jgi:hypothetical protein
MVQSASSILYFLIDMTNFHPSKKNSKQKNSYVSSYEMSFVGVVFLLPPFLPSREFSSLGVFGSEKVCTSNVGIGLCEKPNENQNFVTIVQKLSRKKEIKMEPVIFSLLLILCFEKVPVIMKTIW